jgi:cytidine deaminase
MKQLPGICRQTIKQTNKQNKPNTLVKENEEKKEKELPQKLE